MTTSRTTRPTLLWRRDPEKATWEAQKGILTSTQHRQAETKRSTSPPVEARPRLAGPPVARNTRRAVTSTRDWATWVPTVAAKARHHHRAMPSVWGRAWQTSATGAATTRMTVSATRTIQVHNNTTARTATAPPTRTVKIPPPAREPSTSWRSTTDAWAGPTPCPRSAWESASAAEMARPAKARLALAA